MNRLVNAARSFAGLPRWSFANAIKRKVKGACTFMSNFEQALVCEALRGGHDGVVCGHVHKAELRTVSGERDVVYANCGDWIERSSAIVEHHDGRLELIDVAAKLEELGIMLEAEPDESPAVDPAQAELFIGTEDVMAGLMRSEGTR